MESKGIALKIEQYLNDLEEKLSKQIALNNELSTKLASAEAKNLIYESFLSNIGYGRIISNPKPYNKNYQGQKPYYKEYKKREPYVKRNIDVADTTEENVNE